MTKRATMPGPRRPGAETILHSPDEPIYSELAERWRAAGRSVPGEPDPAWEMLISSRGRRRCSPRASAPNPTERGTPDK